MATVATQDLKALKAERAKDQEILRNEKQLEAKMLSDGEALKAAQEQVARFERVPGYLRSFELAFARSAQAYNDTKSTIRNRLRNGSTDEDLKGQWEQVTAVHQRAIKERDNTRSNLKRETSDHESTISRIALQRGQPAILGPNDELPWSESWISKKFTKMQVSLGHVPVVTWAITHDRQNIAFSPAVRPEDVKFYVEQFNDGLRSLRMAQAAHDLAEEQLAAAEEAKQDVKNRMIWSPI